jgi:hypothetical protein
MTWYGIELLAVLNVNDVDYGCEKQWYSTSLLGVFRWSELSKKLTSVIPKGPILRSFSVVVSPKFAQHDQSVHYERVPLGRYRSAS